MIRVLSRLVSGEAMVDCLMERIGNDAVDGRRSKADSRRNTDPSRMRPRGAEGSRGEPS